MERVYTLPEILSVLRRLRGLLGASGCYIWGAVRGSRPSRGRLEGDMSVTEALRTQATNLHAEIQRLQVDNTKVRGEQPEEAARVDAKAEIAQVCRE